MKRVQQKESLELRRTGMSIKEIAKVVGVSKASVSVWVRDVSLSAKQRKQLTERGQSRDVIEKRRENRIANTLAKHQLIIDAAGAQIPSLSKHELLLVGSALYWGEGGKTKTGMARIANSDPRVIKFMMRFFTEICEVKPEKFRGHVHTFSHLNAGKAERYWSEVSGIPTSQFFKTYAKPSIAGSGHKDSTPYGTFQIYVCDTRVFLTVKGWIQRISDFGDVPLKYS